MTDVEAAVKRYADLLLMLGCFVDALKEYEIVLDLIGKVRSNTDEEKHGHFSLDQRDNPVPTVLDPLEREERRAKGQSQEDRKVHQRANQSRLQQVSSQDRSTNHFAQYRQPYELRQK